MSHKQLRNMHIEKEEIMLYQFDMRMKKTASNIVHYKYQYRCTGREREREQRQGLCRTPFGKETSFFFWFFFSLLRMQILLKIITFVHVTSD